MKRRQFAIAAALSCCTAFVAPAHAQSDKVLKILLGFPAGTSLDNVMRVVADKLKDELKRPVIIENKPGAGGRLAVDMLKNSAPDGNTVMAAPMIIQVLAPMVFSKLNYDPQADLAPVVRVVDFNFALAVPAASPAKTLKDYVNLLKSQPNQTSFGSPAAGSLGHFFGVMIGTSVGVDMVHVAYNGGAAMQAAVIGEHVPAGIDVASEWVQNAKAGKVTVIGVAGAQRSKLYPDVPTFREQGYPDIQGVGWFAMYAPGKTPSSQIDPINRAVNKVLGMPEVRDRLTMMGFDVAGGSPADLAQTTAEDIKRWGPVVKKSGFRAD